METKNSFFFIPENTQKSYKTKKLGYGGGRIETEI